MYNVQIMIEDYKCEGGHVCIYLLYCLHTYHMYMYTYYALIHCTNELTVSALRSHQVLLHVRLQCHGVTPRSSYIYSMAIPVYSTGNSGVFRARGGLKRLEYSLTTIKHKVHD